MISLTVVAKDYSLLFQEYPEVIILEVVLLVALLAGSTLNIVRRKRKEKAYKDTNEWMRRLISSMPDMALVYDNDLNLIDIINPMDSVMLGLPPEEIEGKNLRDIKCLPSHFASALKTVADNAEDTLLTGKSNNFEYEVTVNGKTHYFVGLTVPFLNNQVICFTHDETEYVAAEKKTVELKSFFQAVVDNLPIGLLVKDISNELRYVFFNNYLLDFFGNDNPFQIGQNDMDRWEPMTEEFIKEDMMVVEKNEPVVFNRVSYDEETGEPTRWSITTKNTFTGSNGTPYLMAATFETTESRKKDYELIKTQRELSLVLEAGSISAWTYDVRQFSFIGLNGNPLTKNGVAMDKFLQWVHPTDREAFIQLMSKLSSGELEKGRHIMRISVNGVYEWYETYGIGMRSGKDGKVYQVIGTERNITEDIRKQKSLEEAQSKLELSFNAAQIVPWEIDVKERRFISLGNDSLESTGINISTFQEYILPEDIRLFEQLLEALINGKKQVMTEQMRITFPGQEQGWYEIHALVSERDNTGNVSRIVGLRRDITALKMTDELIELREKAERSNRLKSAFLANMSHEIRTPLNAIVGFSQLIMQTDEKEEQEGYYEIIETNNELLLQLISDILDISKIEADEMDFFYSDFEVPTILHHLEQIYAHKAKPGVVLVVEEPEQPCRLFSERNRLTQVISNFLSNAVKFTSKGSITMGYSYIDKGLRFYVRDTGKGIPPEHLPNVFTRFSKFDIFVQGNGLGLSICEFIIKHLDGEIGVESELGKGTEFWFTIPCEPVLIPKTI